MLKLRIKSDFISKKYILGFIIAGIIVFITFFIIFSITDNFKTGLSYATISSVVCFINAIQFDSKEEEYRIYTDKIVVLKNNKIINEVYISDVKEVIIQKALISNKYGSKNAYFFIDDRKDTFAGVPSIYNNNKYCVRIYCNKLLDEYLKELNIPIIKKQ